MVRIIDELVLNTYDHKYGKQFNVGIIMCGKVSANSANWVVHQIIMRWKLQIGVVEL